eukprot:scaffold3376_cov127-Isochrysis_galbana.AAC.2
MAKIIHIYVGAHRRNSREDASDARRGGLEVPRRGRRVRQSGGCVVCGWGRIGGGDEAGCGHLGVQVLEV